MGCAGFFLHEIFLKQCAQLLRKIMLLKNGKPLSSSSEKRGEREWIRREKSVECKGMYCIKRVLNDALTPVMVQIRPAETLLHLSFKVGKFHGKLYTIPHHESRHLFSSHTRVSSLHAKLSKTKLDLVNQQKDEQKYKTIM